MKKLLPAIALSALLMPQAMAIGNWQNKSYDATYTMSNARGGGSFRLASDGNGHNLVETKMANGVSTIIVDKPAKVSYMITVAQGQKIATKMPYREDSKYVATGDEMRKRNATPLGVKVIAGHPCHGYRYTDKDTGTTDSWIGDDIDFMVETTTNSPSEGPSKMTLQTFSNAAPPAVAFTLPKGIQVMDLGAVSSGDFSGFGGPNMKRQMQNMQMPQGMQNMQLPNGMQLPPGVKLPQGFQMPAGMQMPQGFQMPQGMNMPSESQDNE